MRVGKVCVALVFAVMLLVQVFPGRAAAYTYSSTYYPRLGYVINHYQDKAGNGGVVVGFNLNHLNDDVTVVDFPFLESLYLPLRALDATAFATNSENLQLITLPDTIVEIQPGAFSGCTHPDFEVFAPTQAIYDLIVAAGLPPDRIATAPVVNTPGSTTVAYDGTTIDLVALSELFTVDPHAGAPSYSLEAGGTGAGTVSTGTLTITKTGEFVIGLVTAQNGSYEAGALVRATLTVEKGTRSAPAGLSVADAANLGGTDGKIIGLAADTAYEYRKDGGSYTLAVSNAAGEITGLAAGSYVVRFPANDLYPASPDSVATVIAEPFPAPPDVATGGSLTGGAGTAGLALWIGLLGIGAPGMAGCARTLARRKSQ
ncbi:MAG: leucine-rich repeat domain-containing protein [Propionibacteriaceae bacterium]|nr:leucine-rich repeat domain-containing protein [Propionibacteriaceae bacterium]